jgi:hypothetical protein
MALEITSENACDWQNMSGGAILYDAFIKKGAKLGTQANKMLRELKKQKFSMIKSFSTSEAFMTSILKHYRSYHNGKESK